MVSSADMHELVLIAFANFVFIALKAFQQLNVVHGERLLVVITSQCMALAEIFLTAVYAHKGPVLPLVLTVGISGGLGAIAAMHFRSRFFRHRVL